MWSYKRVTPPPEYPGRRYKGDGRTLEHHFVWWKNTGELVPSGYVIHHKNGKKWDNRFENLEVMKRGAHTQKHRPKEDDVELKCAWCHVPFTRLARYVRTKKKGGQISFCCCRSHSVLHNHRLRKRRGVKHGTASGYGYHRCRCDECRQAHRERHRKYRRSKKM